MIAIVIVRVQLFLLLRGMWVSMRADVSVFVKERELLRKVTSAVREGEKRYR